MHYNIGQLLVIPQPAIKFNIPPSKHSVCKLSSPNQPIWDIRLTGYIQVYIFTTVVVHFSQPFEPVTWQL